jgi:Ser/Thr protein kinase RdoA (MazF antagonist)
MGAMLRKLHSLALPRYGSFAAGGHVEGKATNAEYIDDSFAHSLERFCHFGGDEALAHRLRQIVAANAKVIAHSRGAVFAHDDFQPNNLLAARDDNGRLRLTGLIDFGNARASDPVCDLAKTLFCSEHDSPGSRAAILEGYGPIDHPDPDAAIWIYLLLHRLTMWWWLRHINVIQPGERHALMFDLESMANE